MSIPRIMPKLYMMFIVGLFFAAGCRTTTPYATPKDSSDVVSSGGAVGFEGLFAGCGVSTQECETSCGNYPLARDIGGIFLCSDPTERPCICGDFDAPRPVRVAATFAPLGCQSDVVDCLAACNGLMATITLSAKEHPICEGDQVMCYCHQVTGTADTTNH